MSQDDILGARKFSFKSENLARGQTYMAITNGKNFKHRLYQMAGCGRPDRTRMSFNAIALIRVALLEGMQQTT